jgi:hypothetical protein
VCVLMLWLAVAPPSNAKECVFPKDQCVKLLQAQQDLERCNGLYGLSLESEVKLELELQKLVDRNLELQSALSELGPQPFDWKPVVYGVAVGAVLTTAAFLVAGSIGG